jgi:hypothetical protein
LYTQLDTISYYFKANGNKQSGHAAEEISLQISPAYIIFFVLLMCGMLVMLYFFFDYLGILDLQKKDSYGDALEI